jgi:hypothetical protein
MKSRLVFASLTALALVFAAGAASAQDADAQIKKLPGYVDFQAGDIFKGKEAKVEVYLKEPMLNLVSKFMKNEDADMHDILSKLKLVRVQVFDVDEEMAKEFTDITATITAMLDKKGWERIVRVREEDDNVDIYLRPSENYESILGIVVLVAENEEAVFVNIVGEINPEDISRLGREFDIDELGDVHIDKKKSGK